MRDIKQQERKQRHQNAAVETARNANCGTMLWGWKMRDMKQRHSKKAGEEIARKESAAQKCRSGNCEKWKLRHNVAGVENARHENSGKADYGKLLTNLLSTLHY